MERIGRGGGGGNREVWKRMGNRGGRKEGGKREDGGNGMRKKRIDVQCNSFSLLSFLLSLSLPLTFRLCLYIHNSYKERVFLH